MAVGSLPPEKRQYFYFFFGGFCLRVDLNLIRRQEWRDIVLLQDGVYIVNAVDPSVDRRTPASEVPTGTLCYRSCILCEWGFPLSHFMLLSGERK